MRFSDKSDCKQLIKFRCLNQLFPVQRHLPCTLHANNAGFRTNYFICPVHTDVSTLFIAPFRHDAATDIAQGDLHGKSEVAGQDLAGTSWTERG
jgi:hypothetical protein